MQSYSINGNNKTKFRIIAREINFKANDTIDAKQLFKLINNYQNRIYNLQLFNKVDCTVDTLANKQVHLQFTVTENNYWGIGPNARLADRNFNVWFKEYNKSLGRVDYIVNTTIKNIQGFNRTLQASLQLGFNNAAMLRYTIPNIGKLQNNKISFGIDYVNTRQFHSQIKNDKQVFFKNDDAFVFNKIHAEIMYTKRLQFYKNITASANWYLVVLGTDLKASNPNLLPHQLPQINYWQLNLQYDYNNVDNIYFPLQGWHTTATFTNKFGLGIQQFSQHYLYVSISRHQPLPHRFFANYVMRSRVMIQNTEGFYFQRALGFGNDYVRGYEYFVINGGHFTVNRLEIKKQIINFSINNKKRFWAPSIPIQIYPKLYTDAGAVSRITDGNSTDLRNRLLYSFGAGWEIKFGNYANIRLEYSKNHLNQKGLFLHLTSL